MNIPITSTARDIAETAMNSRVTLFADMDQTRFVAKIPAAKARELLRTGQAASIARKKGVKVRAIYLTGAGCSYAAPMSGVVREHIESERLGGSVGFVWAMRLRTVNGTVTV